MGANRAIHVTTDKPIQPLTAARALLKLVEKEQPQLVILGKQAIDDDCSQTGQMLAALWGRPQATFASELEVNGGVATVTREVDAGLEVIEVDLPAVDHRRPAPQRAALHQAARHHEGEVQADGDAARSILGVETGDHHSASKYAPPPKRSKGVMVKDVPELVAALKAKGLL